MTLIAQNRQENVNYISYTYMYLYEISDTFYSDLFYTPKSLHHSFQKKFLENWDND